MQLVEFFKKLFDTSDWPPRWICGKWSEFHGWLYISSDVVIWLAYSIIPVILLWYLQRKPNSQFLRVYWLFAAFILLCGATHIIDAIIFWWPGYRLSALLRFMTAFVSIATVFALIKQVPLLLNGSNKGEQDDGNTNANLQKQLEASNQKISLLQAELALLRDK